MENSFFLKTVSFLFLSQQDTKELAVLTNILLL